MGEMVMGGWAAELTSSSSGFRTNGVGFESFPVRYRWKRVGT